MRPCPLSNPCQLTDDDADDTAPIRSADWIVWQRKDLPGSDRSLWFSDGDAIGMLPGSVDPDAFPYTNPAAISGSRLVWWGADGADSDGIFLADLAQPLASGDTSMCPLTNPCRVAAAPVSSPLDTGPAIEGTRIVWSARTGVGEDLEVHLFDVTQAADAASPLACPLSNPCLLTANEHGDAAPIVSPSLIAWAQCEDAACLSYPPDRLVFDDGVATTEVVGEWAGEPAAISGSRIMWSAFLMGMFVLDTAQPIDVDAGAYPSLCPLSNPCYLDATIGVGMAGRWLLATNETDIVPEPPTELRLFDLERPLDPRPYSMCPGTNPCLVTDEVDRAAALSTETIAWFECRQGPAECAYPYAGSFDLYVVPEPNTAGTVVAVATLIGVVLVRSKRFS